MESKTNIDYFRNIGCQKVRRGKSCQDQIVSLTSIIHNRQAHYLFTLAAFVDIQKTFDWVDRDLLFLKLHINNIDGILVLTLGSGKVIFYPPLCLVSI